MNTEHVRISTNPDVQQRYERMRESGETHAMAEMLALRLFPAVKGLDSDFNQGRVNGNQFEKTPLMGDRYRKLAEAAGVSTTGKRYMHELALIPGDPMAWVGDESDVPRQHPPRCRRQ